MNQAKKHRRFPYQDTSKSVFPLRFGQRQNCPNRFDKCKFAQENCKYFANISSINLPKIKRTLPKCRKSLLKFCKG